MIPASGVAPDAFDGTPPRPLTVADVLRLPVLAAGQPKVVCGRRQLSRPVRWVHVTELTDPATFLKGGELVLTTGMPLPTEPALVRRYVDELADVGAAGLVIELVRRYRTPPDELVRACRARDLPLVVLAKDVNFVDVTQTVHALILGSQVETLRRAQQVHEAFTTLTLRGAPPEELVHAAAEMSGCAIVLENLVHQAVLYEPASRPPADVLIRWERRSRATVSPDHTEVCGPESWLVTPVEYRGQRWGRLIMLPDATDPPAFGAEHVMVLERAAMALTIARLMQDSSWERTAHRTALLDVVEHRFRSPEEARARLDALGVPTDGYWLMVILVSLVAPAEHQAALEDGLARQLLESGVPALVAGVSPTRIGALLAVKPSRPWRPVVERLSARLHTTHPTAVVTVGREVPDIAHAVRSFQEAAQVAAAAVPDGRPFYQRSDIGLRELLYALREDLQVQDYIERHIGRLVEYDDGHGTDLATTLYTYLEVAGNKTLAARRSGLSRQALYERLRTIERLLARDLESGRERTQLHVALIALEALRPPRNGSLS